LACSFVVNSHPVFLSSGGLTEILHHFLKNEDGAGMRTRQLLMATWAVAIRKKQKSRRIEKITATIIRKMGGGFLGGWDW